MNAPAKNAPKKAPTKTATKAAPAPDAKAPQEIVNLAALTARVAAVLPGMSKSSVARAVEETFAQMTAAYAEGRVVNIKDFGKLAIVHRPARTARNPATGESVQVPAKTVPKFTFAKKMKEMVPGE